MNSHIDQISLARILELEAENYDLQEQLAAAENERDEALSELQTAKVMLQHAVCDPETGSAL